MKAMMLTDYRRLEIQDVPEPELPGDAVLIRVGACGICGSDIHGYDGSTGRRIPPLVMGHEAAGVVERVGSDVHTLTPGQRVTFDSTVYCGRCFFCRRGEINLCEDRRVLGVSCDAYRQHGAFAEFIAVPDRIVYPLPEGLSFEHAAMVEAVSVAVHATDLTPLRLGDSAVVVGAGMIGLLIVQALKLKGCDRVVAVDIDEGRLQLAAQLGATDTLHAERCEVPAEVQRRTAGRGADVVLEAVGTEATVAAAVAACRKGGTVTLVGNVSPQVTLPLQSVVTRQVRLQGSCASSGEYPACIELMAAGKIDVQPLISATVALADAPAYFDRLYRREPGLMKVIVQP